jgi:hypothetical protein
MVCFQTNKSQFGKIWRILQGNILAYFMTIWCIVRPHWKYFMAIWYILWSFGIFCGHLVYFEVIWYILGSFGIFFPVLVSCTKKNLATLIGSSYVFVYFIVAVTVLTRWPWQSICMLKTRFIYICRIPTYIYTSGQCRYYKPYQQCRSQLCRIRNMFERSSGTEQSTQNFCQTLFFDKNLCMYICT